MLNVNVEAQVGLHEVCDQNEVAPLGSPDTDKDTACVVPDVRVELMVLLTEEPCVTETFPEFDTEKSKAGAAKLQMFVVAELSL